MEGEEYLLQSSGTFIIYLGEFQPAVPFYREPQVLFGENNKIEKESGLCGIQTEEYSICLQPEKKQSDSHNIIWKMFGEAVPTGLTNKIMSSTVCREQRQLKADVIACNSARLYQGVVQYCIVRLPGPYMYSAHQGAVQLTGSCKNTIRYFTAP